MSAQQAVLDFSRPLIMGILNRTPDSFSDGGRYPQITQAVDHALAMIEQGADLIDVGGESTRPGSARVPAAQQCERVVEVIERLVARAPGVPISIDTTLSEVARAALRAGASIINDISAGRDDPEILALAAESGAPIILMHMQGTPRTMQDHPRYRDVVAEVCEFLQARAAAARRAGVSREAILVDPGIGFGKRSADNLALLANLDRLVAGGFPVVLGASRKRFMGSICNETVAAELAPATCATTALGVLAGVSVFRVHDVRENRQAAEVTWAIKHAGAGDNSRAKPLAPTYT